MKVVNNTGIGFGFTIKDGATVLTSGYVGPNEQSEFVVQYAAVTSGFTKTLLLEVQRNVDFIYNVPANGTITFTTEIFTPLFKLD